MNRECLLKKTQIEQKTKTYKFCDSAQEKGQVWQRELQASTIVSNLSILDVLWGSGYASGFNNIFSNLSVCIES